MRRLVWIALAALNITQAGEVFECQLISLDGKPISLSELCAGSNLVYLDFWASWCSSCAHSFEFLNAWQEEFGARGLKVVAINLDENPEEASAFLAKYPVRFTIVLDPDQNCAKTFNPPGMPFAYIIDAKGQIRERHLGFRAEEADAIKAKIQKLLAEAAGP